MLRRRRHVKRGAAQGAGGEPQHCAEAVAATVALGRFLFIETSFAFGAAWAALLPRKLVLRIVPREGQHPIRPPAGETRH